MRENRLSGSMSGNRKQRQAKPDCGGDAKAQPHICTGRLPLLRLFSTLPIDEPIRISEGETEGR